MVPLHGWLTLAGLEAGIWLVIIEKPVKEVPGRLLVILPHPCNIVCCEMLHA
jgi:hypothetical protein